MRRRRARRWDSPLLLIGGGALLFLVLLTVGLVWSIRRENAGEVIRKADEDYAAQADGQAIHHYTAFLQKFPRHDQASYAKVRLALARLRQAVESSNNWPAALELARKELTQIAGERGFGTARDELAALLPAIAAGLSTEALRSATAITAEAAPEQTGTQWEAATKAGRDLEEALALIRRYVREDLINEARLREFEESQSTVQRSLARGERLTRTLAAMRTVLDRGEPEAVQALRTALLADYPELEANPALMEMAQSAARDLPSRVQRASFAPPEASTPAAMPRRAIVPYWRREGEIPPGVDEPTAFFMSGAVYGLDPSSGNPVWRREVGRDAIEPPLFVSDAVGRSFFLVDARSWNVSRVKEADGALEWQLAVGEPFTLGTLGPGSLVAAARSGTVLLVDAASGQVAAALRIPQEPAVLAAAAAGRGAAYVLAEHSHLFVLPQTFEGCRQAVYLGHEPGSVIVSPAVLPRCVVVAENASLSAARLRVLRIDPTALTLEEVQSLPLQGNVTTAMAVQGRRLAVATDLGAIYVFEEEASPQSAGLRQVVHRPATERTPVDHYVRMRDPQLIVAANQLTQYEIQATRARIDSQSVFGAGDLFFSAPRWGRGCVVSFRQEKNLPGAVVNVRRENAVRGGDVEIVLAVPLAGEPVALPQGLLAMTQRGDVVHVKPESDGMLPAVRPAAQTSESASPVWNRLVHHAAQRMVWSAAADPGQLRVVTWSADDASDVQARVLHLPARRKVAAAPVWFAGGLLYGDTLGLVHWVDVETGAPRCEPFLPLVRPGEEVAWSQAAVADGHGNSVIVSDGDVRLFRLEVRETPVRRLVTAAERELDAPPVAPAVVLGSTVYLLQDRGQLTSLRLEDLVVLATFSLGSEATLAPCVAGERMYVATNEELFCFDGSARKIWSVPWKYGPISGPPASVDAGIVITSQAGNVVRLVPEDGTELGEAHYGVPLATGALVVGGSVFVGGDDGTILELAVP